MIQCLLVEDDRDIRELVSTYLQGYGMAVVAVSTGQGMRDALRVQDFDVLLLDLMLPDANGLDLCRHVRAHHALPVIMLTAQGDPVSRVVGLEMGADDYVSKPFDPRELVARIGAVIRRTGRAAKASSTSESGEASLTRFQGWTLDRLKRQLTSPDRVVVQLSTAEYRLLAALVDHPEKVLSRDRLLALSRASGAIVSDRSIDLTVSRLRHKLRDVGQGGGLIRTLRGEGYVFASKVSN